MKRHNQLPEDTKGINIKLQYCFAGPNDGRSFQSVVDKMT